MKVALLGFTVPDSLLAEINASDTYLYTQTHRFAWSVTRALRSAGCDVQLLSAAPASPYPHNPRAVWRGGSFDQDGVRGKFLPYINIVLLRHVTRFLACLTVGTRFLRRRKPDVIMVHGVHSPFLWYAHVARRVTGAKIVALVTDPPGVVLDRDSGLVRALKLVDIGTVKRALGAFDGVIVLSEPLAQDFAAQVPDLVMEGIAKPVSGGPVEPAAVSDRASPPRITYAGTLSAEYGVGRLADAVELLNTEVELHLFGNGPLSNELALRAVDSSRIRPPRVVAPEDLAQIYSQSHVLVQPRPVDQDFVPYSFPSKLIEYLATGVPTVTTRLPSIPSDYEPWVSWAGSGEVAEIRDAIEECLELTDAERGARALGVVAWINGTRGEKAQGQRMRRFLEELTQTN